MASTGTKLFKVASQINIGREAIVEYLVSKGFKIENKATTVLTDEMVDIVSEKFSKELKVAEKQREKVERQRMVRKTLLEHGDSVSIDSLAEQHEREAEIEARMASGEVSPSEAAAALAGQVATEHAAEAVSADVPEVSAPPVVHEEPAAVAPAPAEPTPVVAAEAPTAPVDVPAPAAETPAEADNGPRVGTVIDLASLSAPRAPQPKPAPERAPEASRVPPAPAVVPPAPAAVPPVAVPPTPAPAAATTASPMPESPAAPVVGTEPTPASVAPASEPTPAVAAEVAAPAATAQPQTESPAPGAAAPAAAADADTKSGDTAPDAEHREKKKRKRVIEVEYQPGEAPKLKGLTVLGKIDLTPKPPPARPKRDQRPGQPGESRGTERGGGRGTIGDAVAGRTGGSNTGGSGGAPRTGTSSTSTSSTGPKKPGLPKKDDKKKRKNTKGMREQFSDKDVDRAIRQTLSGMEDAGGSSRNKSRMRRRLVREEREAMRAEERLRDSSTLRLSEFVTTADLANLMRVSAPEIIMKCMSLGLMVSINQRLDRDTITLIADDYGFQVEFLDDQTSQEVEDVVDDEETLVSRSPIVTIMGHVDHGKTSLLDYIRNANVVAGEAGGITQHIGAYRVEVPNGRSITFLDTPGHEAFTAMRARGAQVTDIVVLVVAADDSVMPQTIEAISHAQAANVPIVVAINKIDRPEANPDRIRQQLSDHGVLVEEWGGKFQAAEISAKSGLNVDRLLEKILIEADLMDLKSNPDRNARATVIEAHVDKGRGNVVTLIVQKGTLNVGDIFVCGQFAGRVRAMTDERGNKVESAGPSVPVMVTGFDGLPNSGDILVEMDTDAEAREIATRRQQLRREQQFRGMRHMTLDDISAQISAGGVKELRLVVKGDVSGSVEALTDSLQKLSTAEVQVRILYKAVGAITESDIMLAAASDGIIVGFQVNVSPQARKLAEAEDVDVRLYSIIYDCINEVQLALEGLLTPDLKEEILSTIEVRATFKISRLGTIAGCYVQNGKITRNDKVRVLRDGFEIYKGTLASLKRNKDDVREVDAGYECGIGVNGFNDIAVGDIIESYKTIEVKRTLNN